MQLAFHLLHNPADTLFTLLGIGAVIVVLLAAGMVAWDRGRKK